MATGCLSTMVGMIKEYIIIITQGLSIQPHSLHPTLGQNKPHSFPHRDWGDRDSKSGRVHGLRQPRTRLRGSVLRGPKSRVKSWRCSELFPTCLFWLPASRSHTPDRYNCVGLVLTLVVLGMGGRVCRRGHSGLLPEELTELYRV